MKIKKRQPVRSNFEIDIFDLNDAKEWIILFDPNFDCAQLTSQFPMSSSQSRSHVRKVILWEKSFPSARVLEPILGKRFHRCDQGSHTCSLFLQSGIEGAPSSPLVLKIIWCSVSSFQSGESQEHKSLFHYYLTVSFRTIVTQIQNEKGCYELAELYAASSSEQNG
jgi:hypothetical protein